MNWSPLQSPQGTRDSSSTQRTREAKKTNIHTVNWRLWTEVEEPASSESEASIFKAHRWSSKHFRCSIDWWRLKMSRVHMFCSFSPPPQQKPAEWSGIRILSSHHGTDTGSNQRPVPTSAALAGAHCVYGPVPPQVSSGPVQSLHHSSDGTQQHWLGRWEMKFPSRDWPTWFWASDSWKPVFSVCVIGFHPLDVEYYRSINKLADQLNRQSLILNITQPKRAHLFTNNIFPAFSNSQWWRRFCGPCLAPTVMNSSQQLNSDQQLQ